MEGEGSALLRRIVHRLKSSHSQKQAFIRIRVRDACQILCGHIEGGQQDSKNTQFGLSIPPFHEAAAYLWKSLGVRLEKKTIMENPENQRVWRVLENQNAQAYPFVVKPA